MHRFGDKYKILQKKKQTDHQLTFFDQSNHTRSERKILRSIDFRGQK